MPFNARKLKAKSRDIDYRYGNARAPLASPPKRRDLKREAAAAQAALDAGKTKLLADRRHRVDYLRQSIPMSDGDLRLKLERELEFLISLESSSIERA